MVEVVLVVEVEIVRIVVVEPVVELEEVVLAGGGVAAICVMFIFVFVSSRIRLIRMMGQTVTQL